MAKVRPTSSASAVCRRSIRADPDVNVYDEYPADLSIGAIFVRAGCADLTGRLYVPKRDLSGMIEIDFKIPPSDADEKYRHDFYAAEAFHYGQLVREQRPGNARFRHESRKARERWKELIEAATIPGMNNVQVTSQRTEVNAYDLFSGGCAVSENLQIDRSQPAAKRDPATVAVDSLEGISIAAIDWSQYLRCAAVPTLDPLAAEIPENQHALFFPTFAKLIEVIDEAVRQGATALQFGSPRSQDQRVRQRDERQLCLSQFGACAAFGAEADPQRGRDRLRSLFRHGNRRGDSLRSGFARGIERAACRARDGGRHCRCAVRNQSTENWKCTAARRFPIKACALPIEKVCSYVARLGNVVVVTNSLVQLQHLADVQNHCAADRRLAGIQILLARYKLGSGDESAFLFISDATIRRWCGPKWRIASSRRTRDMAVMYDLQADMLDKLVAGHVPPARSIPIWPAARWEISASRRTVSNHRRSVLWSFKHRSPSCR